VGPPRGTTQTFTLLVGNSGPSDAVDVIVDDPVNGFLDIQNIDVSPAAAGSCSWSDGDPGIGDGQDLTCTLDIPAGESVLVTVTYIAAPFLDPASEFGTEHGSEFRFLFYDISEDTYHLVEGSTDPAVILFDGVSIYDLESGNATTLTRNDMVFDPPGTDDPFFVHLSCSDPFAGGWGEGSSAGEPGPVEGVDDWQIVYFSINRFKPNGFFRGCGNVVNEFPISNTATVSGVDSFDEDDDGDTTDADDTDSDTASIVIGPGIVIERVRPQGKHVHVDLINYTGADKQITEIWIDWPSDPKTNGNLVKIRLDGGLVWDGVAPPPNSFAIFRAAGLELIDGTQEYSDGWVGDPDTLTLNQLNHETIRLEYAQKTANTGYAIRLVFDDMTFMEFTL
jgi:hypothetical protein